MSNDSLKVENRSICLFLHVPALTNGVSLAMLLKMKISNPPALYKSKCTNLFLSYKIIHYYVSVLEFYSRFSLFKVVLKMFSRNYLLSSFCEKLHHK